MIFSTELIASELRDGSHWIVVSNDNWVAVHRELASLYPRFEWLTAVHHEDDNFAITTMVSTADLSESVVTSARVAGECASLVEIFAQSDFYEREVIQMFGVTIGDSDRKKAFDVEFPGHPLRRDFALTPRQETQWPGAVEPDANARRRPSLAPGVFAEWKS